MRWGTRTLPKDQYSYFYCKDDCSARFVIDIYVFVPAARVLFFIIAQNATNIGADKAMT
jgi:hypothetical protein